MVEAASWRPAWTHSVLDAIGDSLEELRASDHAPQELPKAFSVEPSDCDSAPNRSGCGPKIARSPPSLSGSFVNAATFSAGRLR